MTVHVQARRMTTVDALEAMDEFLWQTTLVHLGTFHTYATERIFVWLDAA